MGTINDSLTIKNKALLCTELAQCGTDVFPAHLSIYDGQNDQQL